VLKPPQDRQPIDDLVGVNVQVPPRLEVLETIADLHRFVLTNIDSIRGKGRD